MDQQVIIFSGFAVVVLIFLFWVTIGTTVSLYIQALVSGAHIGIFDLFAMRLRRVDPAVIVNARVAAAKAGIPISTGLLEAHYLAQGHVHRVVTALIGANKAGLGMDFNQACAIDLAGRDVLDAVQTSVTPKVIDVPALNSGQQTIDAVAGNGIQLRVKAKVTVRTNLDRVVGGATEATIIARVGQGIVTTIGSVENHMQVLENPRNISIKVLEQGLHANTAYEIVSIDIADILVGENIGARLNTDRAEADKKVAQALAEQRRAMAVAREQEMVALVQENRAKVVLAEAEIPLAMAEAFRKGTFSVMDYYNLKNVQADTEMRNSIAAPKDK